MTGAAGAAAGTEMGYESPADNSDLELRDTTDRGGGADTTEPDVIARDPSYAERDVEDRPTPDLPV